MKRLKAFLIVVFFPLSLWAQDTHPPVMGATARPTCDAGREGTLISLDDQSNWTDCDNTGGGSITSNCLCQDGVWVPQLVSQGDFTLNLGTSVFNLGGVTSTFTLTLPSSNDAGTPTLGFGTGANTGFYESVNGVIATAHEGGGRWKFSATEIFGNALTSGPVIMFEETSGINPVFTTTGDPDTGIGQTAPDHLALTAGGTEAVRVIEGTEGMAAADTALWINDVATPPTTNPTGGVLLYSDVDTLKIRTTAGTVIDLGGVGSATWSESFIRNNPSNGESFLWFRADEDMTVTGLDCICENATSLVMTARECDANGDTCTDIEAAMTCAITNTPHASTVDNPSIDATDWIRIDLGTIIGSPGHCNMTLAGTKP